MTFETREQYVSFRSEWKAKYKALSLTIRQEKRNLKNAFRSDSPESYRIQRSLLTNRALAAAMMEQIEAVREARRQQRVEQMAEAKQAA